MTTERLSGRLVLGIRAALALLFGLAGSSDMRAAGLLLR